MALRPGITFEMLNQRGTGRLPGLVGFRVTAFDEGRIDAELDIRPDLLAPNGYLHAATVIALADTACGYGCISNLPEGATGFTTVELKSNFIGTALDGTIATVARAAHVCNATTLAAKHARNGMMDERIGSRLGPNARRDGRKH